MLHFYVPIPSKLSLLEPVDASIAIDHQMAIIQVHIGKNFIETAFLDNGYGVNIIMENLRV